MRRRIPPPPGAPRAGRSGASYPAHAQYDPTAALSDIPSQKPVDVPAFDPQGHPDVWQGKQHSNITNISHVQHVFDSRPINTYDWFFADVFQQSITASALGGYTVPEGFNLFLRKISLALRASPPGVAGGVNNAVLNGWGGTTRDPIDAPQINILVNRVPTPLWTQLQGIVNDTGLAGIPIPELFFSDVEFDCFVIVPENQLLSLGWTISTLNGINWDLYVEYYGNMVQSRGRNTPLEAGSPDPVPVTFSSMG
jgi:hypothetical protein